MPELDEVIMELDRRLCATRKQQLVADRRLVWCVNVIAKELRELKSSTVTR